MRVNPVIFFQCRGG